MLKIGLTGSIGMGKSTAAQIFRRLGVPVHDSDACVHRLYRGAAASLIERQFPKVVTAGVVDRKKLADLVLNDKAKIAMLEAIIHPLVRDDRDRFCQEVRSKSYRYAVLDIPLLFESGLERDFDLIVTVDAPEPLQRIRVLARPGMTVEKFEQINRRQLPAQKKKQRSHFVVYSDQGFAYSERQIKALLRSLSSNP